MLGLFDQWRKSTDLEAEFIIRKPLLKLAIELKKRGLKYHALYYTNWAQRKAPKNPLDIYWYAKQNTKAVLEIEKIIKESRADLVMTNTAVAPWAAIAAYNQKIPHVWFIREFGEDFEFRLGREKTFELIGRLSELVVANSETLANFAAKYIDKSKITILYPALDLLKINQLSKQPVKNPFKDPVSLKLVITGRVAPAKGQAIAAAATGILNKQGINCELCVIGAPSDKGDADSLRSAIKKYQIADKIHIVGHQQNPLPYVALADIGIMASSREAFGRTTLEYMGLAKPVIGADSGATPELIKAGVNGYLYKTNDANDLAKVLLKYAAGKDLIKKHGQASRQRASELSVKYTADQLYQKIAQIAANKTTVGQPAAEEEWKHYPIILGPGTKKPAIRLSKAHLYAVTKNLLKSLYIKLK